MAAGRNVLTTVLGYMAAMSIAILCLHAPLIGVVSNAAAQGLAASSSLAGNAAAHRAMLDRYCVVCHNDTLLTAGLSLARLDLADVGAAAATWERVVRKLDSGTMPPAGRPRPDKAARDAFVSWLEDTLDAEFADDPNPGRPAVHRLNRAEYANVIRDLLGLEIDGRSLLPADDSGYGFDNIADVLRLSPGLLERYLTAATRISRQAIGDATIRPGVRTYQLPYLTLVQSGRMSEDLPFGSRGGMSVRHHFPLDGDYVLRIRLERNQLAWGNRVRGLDIANEIDVRLDGVRVKLFRIRAMPPAKGSATDYVEDRSDADLEVRFAARAGTRLVGVTFPLRPWNYEGVGLARLPVASDGHSRASNTTAGVGKVETSLSSVSIEGPFDGATSQDTESRRRIFVCYPVSAADEAPCARTILSTLARRAYRRPATEADVETLLAFYRDGYAEGGFETGIQWALERVLADPNFLFRVERDPEIARPDDAYRISDVELASRLSFFLWSSIPDDELLDLAAGGMLRDPGILERQTRRMLADHRAEALIDNFFGQWLYVRNIASVKPDTIVFPDFDENLRQAFKRETDLFLAAQLREDRSVTELLTADYTFVNERLARHYGIAGVHGNRFRRVTFADDRRAGLLGHGSILTVTSYPNRTSPVLRGKWLLENLLGTPPPPPPPDVPALEASETVQPASMRERMERHRRNPVCANCHSKLDPLGFALENYDGIGAWRSTDAGTPIDASGALPDGAVFDGPAGFRRALLSHRKAFVSTLAEKLLTYALGRGVEYYDMPAVRAIVREAAGRDYRWSALVLGIVRSTPFQMRIAA